MPYMYPRKSKHQLRVKRASAGLGLFAESGISKDDFVVEYYGPMLGDAEADKKGGSYLFEIDKDHTVDGSPRKNIARYINHSCRPNCEVIITGKRLFVHAKKTIQPGEELTYNYGKQYFNDFIKPHGCRCGHHRIAV